MAEKDFYSIDEIAEKLGISIKSVRRMVASGELKSVKIRNLYRISKDAYDDFIKSHEVAPASQNSLFGDEPILTEEIIEKPKKKRGRKPRVCVNSDESFDIFGNVRQDDVNWADISDLWDHPSHSQMRRVNYIYPSLFSFRISLYSQKLFL